MSDLQTFADSLAQHAHEELPHNPHGVYPLPNDDGLVLYSNNPHKDRELEISELLQYLRKRNQKILAEGEYPKNGEKAGQTRVILTDGKEEEIQEISKQWSAIIKSTVAINKALTRPNT